MNATIFMKHSHFKKKTPKLDSIMRLGGALNSLFCFVKLQLNLSIFHALGAHLVTTVSPVSKNYSKDNGQNETKLRVYKNMQYLIK